MEQAALQLSGPLLPWLRGGARPCEGVSIPGPAARPLEAQPGASAAAQIERRLLGRGIPPPTYTTPFRRPRPQTACY